MTDGDDISEVQLAECCKHDVVVCNEGHNTGGADDGSTGAAGGGDIRGVQLAKCCKHSVGVQNVSNTLWVFTTMGTKPGERMMGHLERRVEAISGKFNSQDVPDTLWA